MVSSDSQMKPAPKISILMPVYNAGPYLKQAIESILDQTFKDFEFIIVEDGSTDNSWSILNHYTDPRICLFRNESNVGWIKSLSRGLSEARGEYIARQDADDISVPDRFSRQVAFLDENPAVVLLGSYYEMIDTDGNPIETVRPPAQDAAIRWHLLFHSCFAHTSVMFRSRVLKENQLHYDEDLLHAEDYKLWSQLLKYGKGMNLEIPLVKYRLHPAQMVELYSATKDSSADAISQSNLKEIGLSFPLSDVTLLRRHYRQLPQNDISESIRVRGMFLRVLNVFSQQPGLDAQIVRDLKCKYIQKALDVIPFRRKPPREALQLLTYAFRCAPSIVLSQISRRAKNRVTQTLQHIRDGVFRWI